MLTFQIIYLSLKPLHCHADQYIKAKLVAFVELCGGVPPLPPLVD